VGKRDGGIVVLAPEYIIGRVDAAVVVVVAGQVWDWYRGQRKW
jgi:hypothetical protein